ncbi:MAG: reprolysin-like metallopeptidase [Bacteroidia bacterium]
MKINPYHCIPLLINKLKSSSINYHPYLIPAVNKRDGLSSPKKIKTIISMKNLFTKKLYLFSIIVFLTGNQSWAQSSAKNALTDIAESSIILKGERYTFPKHYRTLRLDKTEMQQLLSQAPQESVQNGRTSNATFNMPMPDGSFSQFKIYETFVMHPDLAAKFPEIKTYAGQGIDDPDATIRLDMTPLGFHAMVLSPKGTVFIDPYSAGTTDDYICYNKKDLSANSNFVCETDHIADNLGRSLPASSGQKSSGTQLRTYRLALACTGEYAATKGGTVSGAMAGMTTSMNRVNGVYETEVAIRMVMVANNNLIVYTNSSTDPYTNGNGSTMLGQNITTCNNVIGSANYDIGHVFSTGGGGVAYLGCVCTSNKAGGVTGNTNPVGDGFDIDYVAHEMGHQFGGSHTFNSSTGSCGGGNRTASAAFEPGSGITIMAYAGICGSDDLAPHSIAYFHTYSFDQIVNYSTTGNGNTCAVTTSTGNTAPVVTSLGSAKSIPISTPFVLTGGATDANGDPLTYSWEEYDLGTAGAWNVQSTTAPMFRPFSPVTSPSRTVPQISDVINNTTTVGELLPNQARTLKFRLTVRDNRTGGGGVMHPDTTLNISVVNNGGAFAVTAPNTAVTWAGGSTQTVTWNVNGTINSPISTANVKISLSTDGGNTFPTVISATTANDGTESITVPNTATTTARIKVEAVGNIFFDMSNVNFTITASAGFTTITTSAISPVNYCAGASVNVSFTTNAAANAGNIFTAQLSSSGGSFASPTAIGTLTSTAAGTIAATIPSGTSTGSGYRIRVVSSAPVVTGSDNGSNITISAQVGAAGIITGASSVCSGSTGVSFSVSAITNATNYTWSLPSGASITAGSGTNAITVNFTTGASSGTVSVFGSNANCTGTASSKSLTVNPLPTVTANNVSGCAGTSIALSGTPAGGTWSVANPYSGPSTSYTHTHTDGNGCTNTSAAANITVNPLPTVTADNVSGCAGTSIALSGPPAGGTWSVANPYSGPSTSYTHTYTDGNGCTNTSAAANITVNPLPTVTANNVSGCAGTSIVLSGTPAGGTWSVANPYSGPSMTYTHTYTDANGCTNTSATANITVNPLPTVTADNVSGCEGTAIALSGTPAGGTWSVANPYSGPSTTYTHTYTDANGCTNTSATANITVNPLPTVTADNVSGCAGSSIALSGTPVGGTWSVANPYSGPSMTYTHTYTDANGCTNISATANITVNPLPNVTADNVSGCEGTAIALSGTLAGGTWSVANPYTGSNTTYTHTYTDGNGCTNTSAVANITVNPLPTVTADNVSGCEGTAIALSGTPAGGTWSVANPFTGSSTAYTHTYTDGNGCTNTSAAANIIVNPLPTVSFSGLASSYNVSAAAATLTGSPAAGTFSGPGISGNTFTPSAAMVGGPYTISYSYTDGNGCSNASSQQTTVTNCNVPAQPGTISATGGNTKVCPGDTKIYYITAVSGASSYTWTNPTGASIVSGQGTTTITINYISGFTASGTLSVVANNACGSSIARTVTITRNSPGTPGVISGLSFGVCNSTGVSYSIVNVAGMSYNWSFSVSTAAIVSGQGTNAVTADYNSAFVSGFLSVTASNACGTSAARTLTVKATPATPASITGATAVCANQSGVPYSISSIATATSYTWTGMTGSHISDGTITSTGTVLTTTATSVTVNFGSTSGKLNVRANNDCGTGINKSLTIGFNCRDKNEISTDEFNVSVHPNPVHDQLNVSFYSNETSEYSIQLIDLIGKVLFEYNGMTVTGENNYQYTSDKIAKGMYFLRVTNEEKKNVSRVTVN